MLRKREDKVVRGRRGDSLVLYMSGLCVFLYISVRHGAVLVQVSTPVLDQSVRIGREMNGRAEFLDLRYRFENL